MQTSTFIEHSHPEHRDEVRQKMEAELSRLVTTIDAHRQAHKPVPSDRAWVKQWPGLGSAKTWAKILKGDFSGLKLEVQIPNYRGVLTALETENKERSQDELYPDLPPAESLTLATLRLLHHHGKDRLILVEGGSGSSKTSSLKLLSRNEAAGSMVLLEACEVTWRSPRAAMKDILTALGQSDDNIPNSTAGMLDKILEILERRGRVILAIDEAHHLTGALLNLIKTLLNRTEVLIILAGMKTLFAKLRAVSSEEAKQLIHNRLFARIEFNGPDIEGAEIFLVRRLGLETSPWRKTSIKEVVARSRNAGHWAYLRRVVDHLMDFGIPVHEIDDATLLTAATNAQNEIA